jgi:hypothetical protein
LISLAVNQLPQSERLEQLAQVVGLQELLGFKVALEQRAWDQQEPQARLAPLARLAHQLVWLEAICLEITQIQLLMDCKEPQ